MRDRDTLHALEEVALLMQYLYMEEGNSVEVKNSIGTPLAVTMTEDLEVMVDNLNFPDTPAVRDEVSVSSWLGMVEQLKEAGPKETADYNTPMKTRWDEIVNFTQAARYLNRRRR